MSWSNDQIIYVLRNYHKMPAQIIAQQVGKTRNAVIGKARRLAIAHNDNHPTRKPYLDEYLHGKGKHQLLLLADER